ncbi:MULTISPECIES: ComEC/Rec2 family competence protein [unclassified Clostridium]|uniref:ComEC/Rec2 family competence protein n=2 Tax=Clostridiaceae TaxID=31979 RepID=UPI001E43CE1D|nr:MULTISPECIES: ComEC/Rec2 family competence protein [unclassified Clostridium]MCD2502642.1 MBL fold metallo-hydrolase [Clostridium sp. NSJ-145]MDU6340631.1 ComEC/Rec2 family competence protein [Clostridium sp.]
MNNKKLKNSYDKAMKKHKGNKKAQLITTVIFAIIALVTIAFGGELKNTTTGAIGTMKVHYIDVGQGDATLVQVNGKNLLIDAGPNKSADSLVEYIKGIGVTTIDHVIATHPHEDHIGGMDEIFDAFEVKNFYSPKVEHTTKTFEKMINAVTNEGLKITTIKAGDGSKIDLGDGTKVEIFSPVDDKYNELNDYSPIMKITFGENSFLFTGDAEKLVEKQVIANGENIDADVLKVGHHGSTTSSSEDFIKEVSPDIAVIPVGEGNDYGHPHKEILELLEKNNINLLRTDFEGTIILESDGENIKVLE